MEVRAAAQDRVGRHNTASVTHYHLKVYILMLEMTRCDLMQKEPRPYSSKLIVTLSTAPGCAVPSFASSSPACLLNDML
jgi:hypothetical protein